MVAPTSLKCLFKVEFTLPTFIPASAKAFLSALFPFLDNAQPFFSALAASDITSFLVAESNLFHASLLTIIIFFGYHAAIS